jgi:hypothetical protein
MEEAAALAAELLGVTYDIALQETAIQRGGYFGQQWLYHCYQRNVHLYQRFDCAARAYMLMLVGCTIFADKSYTRVDAKWLPMFRNMFWKLYQILLRYQLFRCLILLLFRWLR